MLTMSPNRFVLNVVPPRHSLCPHHNPSANAYNCADEIKLPSIPDMTEYGLNHVPNPTPMNF